MSAGQICKLVAMEYYVANQSETLALDIDEPYGTAHVPNKRAQLLALPKHYFIFNDPFGCSLTSLKLAIEIARLHVIESSFGSTTAMTKFS